MSLDKFPSTKLNDINLDWLIKQMKQLITDFHSWPRTPQIGANGNWYIWNDNTEAYEDSGEAARGPQGATARSARFNRSTRSAGAARCAGSTRSAGRARRSYASCI